jgi:sugar lactone lactonase YvrE
MRASLLLPALVLFFLHPAARADQFATGQAADVVLGQVDFGSAVFGASASASVFVNPFGVARDSSTGKVFISDTGNNRVLRFSSAAAAANGSSAEAVFGQPNFTEGSVNQGGAAMANTLNTRSQSETDVPGQIAFDSNGRLWVADTQNHRVLGYLIASLTGNNVTADFVFGQPNFTATAEPGTATAANMKSPSAVWVDGDDNLWVADRGHHRILRFDNVTGKADGAAADGVIGQANFTGKDPGTTNATFDRPLGICVDGAGRLWVADSGNNRVLRFDAPTTTTFGLEANAVLGQGTFLAKDAPPASATGMSFPTSVFADAEGTLWVSDSLHFRVLGFRNAAAKNNGAAADLVLGQPNLTSGAQIVSVSDLSARRLAAPVQIAGGANGSIWVVDTNANRVLRYSKVPSPRLTIATRPFTTGEAKVPVRGTTAGEVTQVTQRVGKRGPFRKAKGTAKWRFTASLKPGRNFVTVVAEGPGGKSTPKRVVITRQ